MTNGNAESGPDVEDFVALLREFVSSGVGVLPGPTPIGKPATVTTPTGSVSVSSIAGFEVGCVLIVDSGVNEERFVVEEIDGDNCHVRPWGGGGDRVRWGFRWLRRALRRLWPGRRR